MTPGTSPYDFKFLVNWERVINGVGVVVVLAATQSFLIWMAQTDPNPCFVCRPVLGAGLASVLPSFIAWLLQARQEHLKTELVVKGVLPDRRQTPRDALPIGRKEEDL
jgi:hypothetical protein